VIGELKPYAEYKDSGLPWLGQVPRHWEVRRIKTVLREVDRRSSTGRETLLSLRMQAGLVDYHALGGKPIPPSALVGYKRVLPGEIVMNRMRASAGLFAAATSDGLVSPDYAIFQPVERMNVAYAVQLFRTPAMRAVFRLESTGLGTGESGFLRLYSDQFGRLAIPGPPIAEQDAIVRFLDWANERLERTIQAKRKVISLLTEQKQAIIHSVVTQGLDPTVPLKPSGVEWIGSIPKHWEVLSLKRVLRRLIDCEHKTAPLVDQSPYRVVRTTAVRQGALRMRGTYCTSSVAFGAWTRRGIPEPGDVIFTREAPAGEACIVPEGLTVCLGQRTVLMKPNKKRLNSEFLVHSIYAGPPRVSITLATQGSTVGHFNMSDIGALTILLPPKTEQDEIVAAILERTAGLERTIARFDREIELLREYRVRLVANVVTGRLDVREAAARLPDEAAPHTDLVPSDETDEPELTDEEAAA
jgi:type I restriction enzyme, S subunit